MASGKLINDHLSRDVIDSFYEVYRELGFGFLEHPYARAMDRELGGRSHKVGREVAAPLFYKGEELCLYRMDMLVDDTLIIEIKSSLVPSPTALRQLHTYLRCTDIEIGFLLHFGPEPKFYRRILTNDHKNRPEDKTIKRP